MLNVYSCSDIFFCSFCFLYTSRLRLHRLLELSLYHIWSYLTSPFKKKVGEREKDSKGLILIIYFLYIPQINNDSVELLAKFFNTLHFLIHEEYKIIFLYIIGLCEIFFLFMYLFSNFFNPTHRIYLTYL